MEIIKQRDEIRFYDVNEEKQSVIVRSLIMNYYEAKNPNYEKNLKSKLLDQKSKWFSKKSIFSDNNNVN